MTAIRKLELLAGLLAPVSGCAAPLYMLFLSWQYAIPNENYRKLLMAGGVLFVLAVPTTVAVCVHVAVRSTFAVVAAWVFSVVVTLLVGMYGIIFFLYGA